MVDAVTCTGVMVDGVRCIGFAEQGYSLDSKTVLLPSGLRTQDLAVENKWLGGSVFG